MGPRLLAAAFVAALLAVPSSAPGATTWLCEPGASPNPCTSSLTTTVRQASGRDEVDRTTPARRAPIDCFYVYPTVSAQPTDNANKRIDPELTAIAQYQASRFSQHCRVFAPVYRQLTLAAIGKPRDRDGAAQRRAYGDVQGAWREYLRRHNKGRGVVLIGHSQGTFMLRELIRREIDDVPSVRRRLVSALLLGGNVEVRRGSDRGGDFANVPLCRRFGQIRCVVAYSMYDTQPPANARFARASAPSREIACTNPVPLARAEGLDAYARTTPFPGTLGVAVNASTDVPSGIATPWVAFPDRATAQCRRTGRLSWLQVTGRPGDPRPGFRATIGADWGLHLGDVNLALGQLTDIVLRQATSYGNR